MKLSLIMTLALLSASAFSAEYSYKCKQRTDRSAVDPSVGKISVTVTHLKTLATATEYRGSYVDAIELVKVDIRTSKGLSKSLVTKATSEDVSYVIKDNGVDFYVYMDELEEAGIKTKLNGKKVDVALKCDI
jgi:hypothetical protein